MGTQTAKKLFFCGKSAQNYAWPNYLQFYQKTTPNKIVFVSQNYFKGLGCGKG